MSKLKWLVAVAVVLVLVGSADAGPFRRRCPCAAPARPAVPQVTAQAAVTRTTVAVQATTVSSACATTANSTPGLFRGSYTGLPHFRGRACGPFGCR